MKGVDKAKPLQCFSLSSPRFLLFVPFLFYHGLSHFLFFRGCAVLVYPLPRCECHGQPRFVPYLLSDVQKQREEKSGGMGKGMGRVDKDLLSAQDFLTHSHDRN